MNLNLFCRYYRRCFFFVSILDLMEYEFEWIFLLKKTKGYQVSILDLMEYEFEYLNTVISIDE